MHGDEDQVFWHARREASLRKGDRGTDVFLVLTDLNFQPAVAGRGGIVGNCHLLESRFAGRVAHVGRGELAVPATGAGPTERIVPVVAPTMPYRLPPDQSRWRLVSHLALNHLSVTDDEDGAAALREILMLYDHGNSRATRQQIEGLLRVRSRRNVVPIREGRAHGFCRGVEIDVEFDEDAFVTGGLFLFSAVLERFLPCTPTSIR